MRPLPQRPKTVTDDEAEKTNCCKEVMTSACSPELMTSAPFNLLMFANLCSTMGLYIPYMYIPTQAMNQDINPVDASFLISIVGISNTLGRILSGILTDLPCVDPL